MYIKISEKVAQSIVEAIYEVCSCPINFIDQSGVIIASTDVTRINQFHEAGQEAIKNAETIFVKEEGKYSGTKLGVNYPIFIEGTPVAVVGITGDPKEVSKYGFLATKISEVFIKEQYISNLRNTKKQKMNYLIRSYIYDHIENESYISQLRDEFHLNQERYGIVCLQVNQRFHVENIIMVERRIETIFKQLHISCYTYLYPNQFVGLLEEEFFDKTCEGLEKFCSSMSEVIKGGVGTIERLPRIFNSFEQAKYAVSCIEEKEISFQDYTKLGLERLLRILKKYLNPQYTEFVLKQLQDKDKQLLLSYFEHNMSLKETAGANFIHVNTLQNKLNKIQEINGMNPRSFQDAVALYLTILVEKMQNVNDNNLIK